MCGYFPLSKYSIKGSDIMALDMPGINYIKEYNTSAVDSDSAAYMIPFEKSAEYFTSLENYNRFINSTEKLIRGSKDYKMYISYLKTEVKLDHCQVIKDVNDEDCKIEMHHGPIFTLYDICAIIIEYYLLKKWPITTPIIAKAVLDEHRKNRVQVVMLASTIHEEVHNRGIFIHYKQAWGDIAAFIKKYECAMGKEYIEKFNRYYQRCAIQDSNDFGLLDLNSKLQKKLKEES